MKQIMIAILSLILTACGGGGSGTTPSAVPLGGVSGVAHDNILVGSTITVYQYENGQAGAVLGTTTTNADGNYSVKIQAESTSLLLIASGGHYTEEASRVQINLNSNQKLRAVVSYTTGAAITTSITTYTNLAAGLAAYRIKQGSTVATAITSANTDISNIVGFNIVNTVPRDITNIANLTGFSSDEYSYGFLSAGISSWTKYASEQSGQTALNGLLHKAINSITFADMIYQDVIADGFLDGRGKNASGSAINLSLGTVPLNQDVYRYGIAAHIVSVSRDLNANKTGLTEADILPFATHYAADVGQIWNNTPVIPFTTGRSSIAFSNLVTNQWVSGSAFPVTSTISSNGAIKTASLSLDGVVVQSLADNSNPFFTLNTITNSGNLVIDGTHTIKIDVVDSFGVASSQSVTVRVDNTAPTSTSSVDTIVVSSNSTTHIMSPTGRASDAGIGVYSVKDLVSGIVVYPNTDGLWLYSFEITTLPPVTPGGYDGAYWYFEVRDKIGNCSKYRIHFVGVANGNYTNTFSAEQAILIANNYTC